MQTEWLGSNTERLGRSPPVTEERDGHERHDAER